ncbi:MAG: type II secretion system F family protein [Acidimicrobiaceae bacterium]
MISLIGISVIAVIYLFYRRRRKVEVSFSKHIPELIDTLLVLIRAGHSPAAAMSQLHNWSPKDIETHLLRVNTELAAGMRFAETMKNLRETLGPCIYPICDILVCADRDGLPITSVLDQLSFHTHQERRRLREIEARELPVRLLFPLVCCILPSFVLLAMVPLLVNSLTVVTEKLP